MKRTIFYLVFLIISLSACQNSTKNIAAKVDTPQTISKSESISGQDFTTTLTVDQSPEKVFNAITNVRGWWSEEIEGNTANLNDVFSYHFEDVHRSKIKLIEVVPNKKVVWLILENYFKFTKDKTEWTGTKVVFNITEKDGKTTLNFTHQGLVPAYECYKICTDAWTNYIHKSLYNLITTGKGNPNGKGKAQTANEKKLSSKN